MPRLSVFVACDNVIIGSGNNAASLIVLLHQIITTLPPDVPDPIPQGIASPLRWYIFAQWEVDAKDVGVQFQQKVEMINAAGELMGLNTISEFMPEVDKALHRMIGNFTFFPLIPEGEYRLRVSIRRAETLEWTESGSYPLQVRHRRVTPDALEEVTL